MFPRMAFRTLTAELLDVAEAMLRPHDDGTRADQRTSTMPDPPGRPRRLEHGAARRPGAPASPSHACATPLPRGASPRERAAASS